MQALIFLKKDFISQILGIEITQAYAQITK